MSFLLALSAVLLLAPAAAAKQVVIQGHPGPFPSLQDALGAARNGDTLLLGPGTHSAFMIDGLGLTLAGLPGTQVRIEGTSLVRGLAAHETLVLSGLTLVGPLEVDPDVPSGPALVLEDNDGQVRLVDATLQGGQGNHPLPTEFGGEGGAALRVRACVAVVLSRCELYGGHGGAEHSVAGDTCEGGDGGHALDTDGSSLGLFQSRLEGGRGGTCGARGGNGGHGTLALASTLELVETTLVGGDGGEFFDSSPIRAGDGGDGVQLRLASHAFLLEVTAEGGIGGEGFSTRTDGSDGVPISTDGNSSTSVRPGVARSLAAPTLAVASRPLPVAIAGAAADRVALALAARPAYRAALFAEGLELVPLPAALGTADVVLDASGHGAALVEPETRDTRRFAQGLVAGPAGNGLSGPLSTVWLDPTSLPDCDANGVNDIVELLDGAAADADGDLLLDACEVDETWFVDAAAPTGGDGSAAAPFTTLREGLDAADSGDTILVGDGVYSGPDNAQLDFSGRDMVLRSQGGAQACIIDLAQGPRAFEFRSGESAAARVEGFTLRNGRAGADGEGGWGGAVLVLGASPTLAHCRFEGNVARLGGAVLAQGDPTIEGCTFTGNEALRDAGALQVDGAATIRSCVFEDNRCDVNGGALKLFALGAGEEGSLVVDCLFRRNVGDEVTLVSTGGAAWVGIGARFVACTFIDNSAFRAGALGVWGEVDVDNCLFVDNRARSGGAITTFLDQRATITSSTFVSNQATDGAAGALSLASPSEVANSILFGNTATQGGDQIRVWAPAGVEVRVRFSDVEGGQGAVAVAGGNLSWGPGNLDLDPALDGEQRPQPGSPCLDAGANGLLQLDFGDLDGDGLSGAERVPHDLSGAPRRADDPSAADTGAGSGALVDMGCLERQPGP